MPEAGAICRDSVRAGDKDIYLATLFTPAAAQDDLFALHAFYAELDRIPRVVNEAQIGEIRLQWWADTLAGLAAGDTGSGHPVAAALGETCRKHALPVPVLEKMVEAARFGLYADTMPDLTALEAHFGETRSALIQLSCMIIDTAKAAQAAEAAGLAGVAFGLSRALTEEGWEKLVPPGLQRGDLIELAARRGEEARGALNAVPSVLLPAFLPLALVPLYLDWARRGPGIVPQWRRQWRLWRAARTEKL